MADGGSTTRSRVAVYVLAASGAILVSVGIGLRFGVAWAFMALGVAMVVGALTLVDIAPRPAPADDAPAEGDAAEAPDTVPVTARIPRPGPRPPVFPPVPAVDRQPATGMAATGSTDPTAGR